MRALRIAMIGVCAGLSMCVCAWAQEAQAPSSGDLIVKAWAAHGKKNIEETFQFTQQIIDLYKAEADRQQVSLPELPQRKPDIEAVQALNDVATAYFIQAESYRDQGKKDESIATFRIVVERYNKAQAWDPRGWYWQIAKASQESIDKLEGKAVKPPEPEVPKVSQLPTKVALYDAGKEEFINYAKYGTFENTGTKEYRYVVKDQEGLSAAAGEGVYPNTTSIRWDPAYKKAVKDKRLEGSHWDFVASPDLQAAFLKWATAPEPPGIKLFYTAQVLEKSGLIKQAIKCYYAIVVHFPGTYGWTYWHTPWYAGPAAIANIRYLLRENPSIGYKLEDADIRIVNGFDNDVANDVVETSPGRFVKTHALFDKLKVKPNPATLSIRKRSGKGKVRTVQYETGDWQLLVDGKPYIIKGITYAPTKVGQSPDNGTLGNWMNEDFNQNGKADGPYDAFVDKNGNNQQDANEPSIGDFKLMKEMGVNTIRLYHHPQPVNKDVLRDLYRTCGIRVIMGDFLGKYALGSGAPWNPGTDYRNEEHRRNMIQSVTQMVLEHKDEPYLLFWLLGNENVYGYACNADKDPESYFAFVNEVALLIKSLDPDHPVAVCSGDVLFLDRFGKYAPDVDIFGANAYRGKYGFGSFWNQVRRESDKPAFITEFGCSAFYDGKPAAEGEAFQAEYHKGSWDDIRGNMAFAQGAGNALGGVVFEYLDEWWKGYEPSTHDTKGLWKGPFPDGTMHEEWLGVAGQGDGTASPFARHLRKAYFQYKKMWR